MRQPDLMIAENLVALLMTLQGGDGNPPSAPTSEVHVETEATSDVQAEIKAITDDAEQASSKRQITDTAPDLDFIGLVSDLELAMSTDPKSATATKETNTQEPDFDFDFYFESTSSHPESSSCVRFEAGSSSGTGFTEHDKAVYRYAIEKRQVVEQSDSDEDVNVARLRRRVIILEQDATLKEAHIASLLQDSALKEAQISSLQAQISSRAQTIDQLQGDLGMLMSIVYDLKAKFEKKIGNEFIDKEDEQFNVGRPEKTPEERAAAMVAANVEHEVGLNAYLSVEPRKKSSKKREKKQSNKQMLLMKNLDMNPLDENFQ
ncbi:hypothetical protein HanOQP8_Chr01g0009551 [Helianthus annuus]|nr:hypothetical protein HanOQP8_Chr01g0009551 [Helianthus annuus]